MKVKFNGGLGAFLCDKCSRIVYTFSDVPEDIKQIYLRNNPEEVKNYKIICKNCQENETGKIDAEYYEKE